MKLTYSAEATPFLARYPTASGDNSFWMQYPRAVDPPGRDDLHDEWLMALTSLLQHAACFVRVSFEFWRIEPENVKWYWEAGYDDWLDGAVHRRCGLRFTASKRKEEVTEYFARDIEAHTQRVVLQGSGSTHVLIGDLWLQFPHR